MKCSGFFSRPLLCSALAFMCGIAAGDCFGLSSLISVSCALVFLVCSASLFCFQRHSVAFCLVLVSIFCAGSAAIAVRRGDFDRSRAFVSSDDSGKKAVVEGAVPASPSFASFSISADRIFIGGEPREGRVLVGVLNGTDSRNYDLGDYVRVRGVLRENFRVRGREAFLLGVYSPSWIENLGEAEVNFFLRSALSIRRNMERIIEETMPPPESLFMKSVLLGKRHVLPGEIRSALSETGAGHFVSVSGLHAGLVLFFLMTVSLIAGVTRKNSIVLCILGLSVFCLMTGFRVPTVRASILAATLLAGELAGRRPDRWNALALAAVLILAFRPEELFSAGFRMSFAAVAGIFYLYPVFAELFPFPGKIAFLKKPVLGVVSVHLAVMPLAGASLGYVPAVSVPANLLLIPMLSFSVALGLAAGAAGMLHMAPARIINAANWGVVRASLEAASFFRRFPWTVPFGNVPAYSLIAYYAGLLALPVLLKKRFLKAEGVRLAA